MKITEAMLDNQDLAAPVATVLEKETEKAVDVELKRTCLRHKFVKAGYSTSILSASSSDRPPTDISDEATKKRGTPKSQKSLHPNYRCASR